MATSVTPTGVTYSDGTVQTTAGGPGIIITRSYTTTTPGQTWDKPAGLKFIKVTLIGGGGGGGASNSIATGYGGPGGTGQVTTAWFNAPQLPAGPFSVVVGAGGTAGAAPGGAGGTGGQTSFATGNPIVIGAPGGFGGSISAPGVGVTGDHGSPPVLVGTSVSTQPVSLLGYTAIIQQPGLYAQGFGVVGNYGSAPPAGSAGSTGTGYGAGGGGGTTASTPTPGNAGGAGRPGAIFIEEYY